VPLSDPAPPGTGPSAPATAVVFSVGPITDTTVPGNSRACVASKSPLTGLFFDSTFGGRFPATLKRTGFDAVVITGRAARPSYLVVTETGALLKPADQLWGRATRDTVQALVLAEGGDADAIAIGPAGEQREGFAAAGVVGGEEMKAHYHGRDTTCLKCPVACGKQYAIPEGEFAGTRAKMPEYETIFALGPMLGIANPEALIRANDLCDLLGL